MKNMTAVLVAVAALLAPISSAHAQKGKDRHSVSVHAESIGGGAGGEVFLTGAGNFDPLSGLLTISGGFHCTGDINGGPLAGCKAGEGSHWEATEILTSSGFKCGTPGEPLKTAFTDDNTLVMKARFFRQGDGANPSFTANVFVSTEDENPDQIGTQNVWIQGVGCGEANVDF